VGKTIEQIAAGKQCSASTVREAIRRGELPAVRVGRRIFIEERAAEAWRRPTPVAPRGSTGASGGGMRRGGRPVGSPPRCPATANGTAQAR